MLYAHPASISEDPSDPQYTALQELSTAVNEHRDAQLDFEMLEALYEILKYFPRNPILSLMKGGHGFLGKYIQVSKDGQ